MWYAPLGFFTSLIIGWLVSAALDYFGLAGEPKIYSDESRNIINADLFTPPLAKRIRKRNAEILAKNFTVRYSCLRIKLSTFRIFYYHKATVHIILGTQWRRRRFYQN